MQTMNTDFFTRERQASIDWARRLLDRDDWVILDTETTGLGETAEAVEIGILAPDGRLEVQQRLRPLHGISAGAAAVHGITDEMVKDAPEYPAVDSFFRQILGGRLAVIYNAAYDSAILAQTANAHGLDSPLRLWTCAMLQYARYRGEWNDYRQSFRWPKLPPLPGQTAHSALADCRSTLAVIREMAGQAVSP